MMVSSANIFTVELFCNEFSYSHGSVTLLGTSHAIFHACWVLVLFILIIVYIKS